MAAARDMPDPQGAKNGDWRAASLLLIACALAMTTSFQASEALLYYDLTQRD